jgi:homocysteine S-methyltransferase
MLKPGSTFTRLLERDQPLLLDGGLATQLEAQGYDIGNDLWSASLLQTNRDAIVAAHRAYISAGAECLETASYQATYEGYAKIGLGPEKATELMLLSIALAKKACDEAQSAAVVAASLGPYGAMLHDGSEYRGDYGVSASTLREFHAERLFLFDSSDVDVLALETIPSLSEAEVLAELLRGCKTPSWVSFSCCDEKHICDGTPIADVATLFMDHPSVVALGINCTSPQYVPALIKELGVAAPEKYTIAYPNSGEKFNISDNSWSGTVTPCDCADAAREWIRAGARIVGGCCRMGPEHIRAMGIMIRAARD